MNRPPQLPDDEARLRSDLRRTVASPPSPGLERLQQQALRDWQARCGPAHLQRLGPLAALGLAWPWAQQHKALGLLLLAGVVALALNLRPQADTALDDLQRPDVLSQMALGEL